MEKIIEEWDGFFHYSRIPMSDIGFQVGSSIGIQSGVLESQSQPNLRNKEGIMKWISPFLFF